MPKVVDPSEFEDVEGQVSADDYEDVPVVDMSPAARRSAAGLPPGPRDLTAEEAGTSPGLIRQSNTLDPSGRVNGANVVAPATTQPGAPADLPPGQQVTVMKRHPGTGQGVGGMFGPPATIVSRPEQGEMADPLVQMGTAAAIGRVAGSPLAAIPGAGAALAPVIEAGTANKAMGGDFTTGAALGAIPLVAKGARAAKAAVMENAPARVDKRALTNLRQDATKKQAAKLDAVAGADNADLTAMMDRNPELRRVLSVHAPDNPKFAHAAVQETKAAANAARDADFEAMQAHYATQPASAQASIPQLIDDFKAVKKTIPIGDRNAQAAISGAQKELIKMADELREVQGLPPAVNGDYSGTIVTPKDLRAFEQTIGAQAFEAVPMSARGQARGAVGSALYQPIAKQVNALAAGTPGVDAAKFATTGEDIHVLIPVEERLKYAVAAADNVRMSKLDKAVAAAKHVSHASIGGIGYMSHGVPGAVAALAAPVVGRAVVKGAARLGRGIDYRMAEAMRRKGITPPAPAAQPSLVPPAVVGAAAAIPERRGGLAGVYAVP